MMRIGFLTGVFILSLTSLVVGQDDDEYERVQIVGQRQSAMFEMQDGYFALFAIKRGSTDDLSTVADNAGLISEKLSVFTSLLVPNTAVGDVPNSRAKPEIWSEPEAFAAAVEALRTEVHALIDASADIDLVSFNGHFDALEIACFGCHGLKPSSGGSFRAPK
jgi:cytochrome c556